MRWEQRDLIAPFPIPGMHIDERHLWRRLIICPIF